MFSKSVLYAVVLSGFLACVSAFAQNGPVQFSGKAYDKDSGQWIYTEQHQQQFKDGKWATGVIKYVNPKGETIAEKQLDFSSDPFVPLTKMTVFATGYTEIISKVTAETVTMEVIENGKKSSSDIKRDGPLAADSGFHAFVQAHMPQLLAGKTVALKFGVIGRQDQYRFRIFKTALTQVDGKNRVDLRVEPDSLLRLVVDPLTLVYDADSRQLLEYNGVSNIPDAKTGKPPKVKIVYSY